MVVHDGWLPYRTFAHHDEVEHALCNPHHLRELDAVKDTKGQEWARDMVAFFADTWHRVQVAKADGATSFGPDELASCGPPSSAYSKPATRPIRSTTPSPLRRTC